MGNGMKIFIALMMGLVLVGCKSAVEFYGEGPINLSSFVTTGFEKYKGLS